MRYEPENLIYYHSSIIVSLYTFLSLEIIYTLCLNLLAPALQGSFLSINHFEISYFDILLNNPQNTKYFI